MAGKSWKVWTPSPRASAVRAAAAASTDAVPFDARDLPGYAVAMFERYRTDARVARLSDWYRLEHGRPGRTTRYRPPSAAGWRKSPRRSGTR